MKRIFLFIALAMFTLNGADKPHNMDGMRYTDDFIPNLVKKYNAIKNGQIELFKEMREALLKHIEDYKTKPQINAQTIEFSLKLANACVDGAEKSPDVIEYFPDTDEVNIYHGDKLDNKIDVNASAIGILGLFMVGGAAGYTYYKYSKIERYTGALMVSGLAISVLMLYEGFIYPYKKQKTYPNYMGKPYITLNSNGIYNSNGIILSWHDVESIAEENDNFTIFYLNKKCTFTNNLKIDKSPFEHVQDIEKGDFTKLLKRYLLKYGNKNIQEHLTQNK